MLTGDSGYPLLPYLMVPKLNQQAGTPSARYTQCHVQARSSVERCIGILKGRWRCLRKERALHYTPDMAGKTLHSIFIRHLSFSSSLEFDKNEDIRYFHDEHSNRVNFQRE